MSNESNGKMTPETQKERWIKYGANVALSVIVVILLAGAIIYLGQRRAKRIDTTAAGIYSLKPQTVNLIKDLKQKIKLVSLYQQKDAQGQDMPYAGPVRDLLEEYASKSSNIEVDVIDPVTQPTKADQLVAEAINKYGGATKAYKDFINEFNATTYETLKQLTSAEATALADVKTDALGEDERGQTVAAVVNTVRDRLPQTVTTLKDRLDRGLKPKFPDYKAVVDRLKDSLDSLAQIESAIVKFANDLKDDPSVPEQLRKYLADSPARHEAIKKLADDAITKINGLGELKVGELQQAIRDQDLILVLGETDWRVLSPSQVWVADTRDLRNYVEGQEIKPRFAGEQAVTTAILSLSNNNKPKVAFIRAGGPPWTTPGFPPFQQGGPLSILAERLRGYNFEILEKDVTGMWAMQSQMRGMPPAPEPSDEEIKDALWIVVDTPQDMRMGPSPTISPKLLEHLSNGGSAMVITALRADDLAEAIKDYGITIKTDAVIVHEMSQAERARSADVADEFSQYPFVFVLNRFGDHLLTRPAESLDALLVGAVPVKTTPTSGVTVTPLLPIPTDRPAWGERNIEGIGQGDVKFDKDNDEPGPFFAGAVAEKGKSRLVVFGMLQSFTDDIVTLRDPQLVRRGVRASRFPANGELFTNAVFWLANMETMIAISPSAMEVSRIAPMSDATLNTWRIGVLMILLPGLVLAAGIAMYFARRD